MDPSRDLRMDEDATMVWRVFGIFEYILFRANRPRFEVPLRVFDFSIDLLQEVSYKLYVVLVAILITYLAVRCYV
jgi:hypothetical protein